METILTKQLNFDYRLLKGQITRLRADEQDFFDAYIDMALENDESKDPTEQYRAKRREEGEGRRQRQRQRGDRTEDRNEGTE